MNLNNNLYIITCNVKKTFHIVFIIHLSSDLEIISNDCNVIKTDIRKFMEMEEWKKIVLKIYQEMII